MRLQIRLDLFSLGRLQRWKRLLEREAAGAFYDLDAPTRGKPQAWIWFGKNHENCQNLYEGIDLDGERWV